MSTPSLALFAPHPLLTVTLEVEGADDRQSIHFHAGGQGVWAAATARCMGVRPVLCGLIGGEPGELLRPLIEKVAGPQECLVQTAGASGCYVTDRRSGERKLLALAPSDPPSRHELDELVSLCCAQAIACGTLLVTNPFPAQSLPVEVYGELVADARAGGARTLVDLSSPRLDSALEGEPDLVKLNDWELAEYVRGPVVPDQRLLAAAKLVRDHGARSVLVTRGELPALVLHGEQELRLSPPRFEHGFREGCGDAMMGALGAAWARGEELEPALVLAAAAGAANFLRRGLGHASRTVIEELSAHVELAPWELTAGAAASPR